MSAREIIAAGFLMPVERADGILKALTDSGYRILAPGELDAETVERLADMADAEGRTRKHNAIDAREGSLNWGPDSADAERIQNHKAVTAFNLAKSFRALLRSLDTEG